MGNARGKKWHEIVCITFNNRDIAVFIDLICARVYQMFNNNAHRVMIDFLHAVCVCFFFFFFYSVSTFA
jgi:hypothetical protein